MQIPSRGAIILLTTDDGGMWQEIDVYQVPRVSSAWF